VWRLAWYRRRMRCVFGLHFWCGVVKEGFDLLNSDFDDYVDYYSCLTCGKEQKESPYKEDRK